MPCYFSYYNHALLWGAWEHVYWPLLQVGRPRPNFAERCWPGGQTPEYNEAGIPLCASNSVNPSEGRKSFPSGQVTPQLKSVTCRTGSCCEAIYSYCVIYSSCITAVGKYACPLFDVCSRLSRCRFNSSKCLGIDNIVLNTHTHTHRQES